VRLKPRAAPPDGAGTSFLRCLARSPQGCVHLIGPDSDQGRAEAVTANYADAPRVRPNILSGSA
jgi:hypothetical protein